MMDFFLSVSTSERRRRRTFAWCWSELEAVFHDGWRKLPRGTSPTETQPSDRQHSNTKKWRIFCVAGTGERSRDDDDDDAARVRRDAIVFVFISKEPFFKSNFWIAWNPGNWWISRRCYKGGRSEFVETSISTVSWYLSEEKPYCCNLWWIELQKSGTTNDQLKHQFINLTSKTKLVAGLSKSSRTSGY